jgi:hypothetical protein
MDLVPLEWNSIRLAWFGPEIGYRESFIEVRPVIIHDGYREHDVHAELGVALVLRDSRKKERGRTDFEDFKIRPSHFEDMVR